MTENHAHMRQLPVMEFRWKVNICFEVFLLVRSFIRSVVRQVVIAFRLNVIWTTSSFTKSRKKPSKTFILGNYSNCKYDLISVVHKKNSHFHLSIISSRKPKGIQKVSKTKSNFRSSKTSIYPTLFDSKWHEQVPRTSFRHSSYTPWHSWSL